MKKTHKILALIMALGLSFGITACDISGLLGDDTSSSTTSSSVSSTESSSATQQKVGEFTAETWAELVSLSSFENCTVDLSVIGKKGGYDLGETSKHLFSADGYSRTGNRSVMGDGTGKQDLKYATDDADEVESERAALLGFLAEIEFEDVTYDSAAKMYKVNGEFYAAKGKKYKDATIQVKSGKISKVSVKVVTADTTQDDVLTFTKYNKTTPAMPEDEE